MSNSLLAYLYPRIKGSQEDIATYSLVYILQQSNVLNESFTKQIGNKLGLQLDGLFTYHCQDSDAEHGRPDIAGYSEGQLKVFCEAKFYAGLTDNQPVGYLSRLAKQGGDGLIFICPENRTVSLWDHLLKITRDNGMQEEPVQEYCKDYCVDDSNVRLAIISWNEIIAELLTVAMARDPAMLGDVEQLRGFCDKIESEAFIPFKPEEFSAQTAREMDRYYQVVDRTYQILCTHSEINISKKGLRKTGFWGGCTQYFKVELNEKQKRLDISIDFSINFWKATTSIETPFWCSLKGIGPDLQKTKESIDSLLAGIPRRHKEFSGYNGGTTYIALQARPYVTLDEVAEDLCQQIIELLMKL